MEGYAFEGKMLRLGALGGHVVQGLTCFCLYLLFSPYLFFVKFGSNT